MVALGPPFPSWVMRCHCVTSLCETVWLVLQDFHRAREPVMMLASVEDDDDDDDNDSVFASGCLCVCVYGVQRDEYPVPQMAGSPRAGVCEASQPA